MMDVEFVELNKQLTKNIKIYNINIVLSTLARTLPHAILTVLLLDKGVSISGIAFIQAMYSLAMILCEFPSGIIADLYSRKFVYIFSLISLSSSYLFIIFSDSLILLCLSWFIYGVSSAMDTGTLDAQIINEIKLNNDENGLQKFLKNINQLSLISSIFGSAIGSFLFFKIGVNIYWISIILILLVLVITSKYFIINEEAKNDTDSPKILDHIKGSFYELKKTPELMLFITLFGIGQFFFQPHFQLWQVLFLYKEVNEKWFFVLYIVFQLITIVSYNINIKRVTTNKIFFISLMGILFLISSLFIENIYLFIIFYLFTCYMAFVINYFTNFSYNKIIPREKISSLTSLSSTITRLFSFFILLISSFMLNIISVTLYFLFSFGLMFLSSMLLIVLLQKKKSTEGLLVTKKEFEGNIG